MLKNKFVALILAVILSFGLWVIVVTVITPDYETTIYNIPVTLEGEVLLDDRDLVLMTQELPTVDLKLYGNRSVLNELDNTNITLKVDLSRVYEAGEQSLTYSISYPGDINGNEIQVQSRDPGRIVLQFENLVRKEIPVVKPTAQAAEGFVIHSEVLEPEKITISGPESAVEPITQAVIRDRLEPLDASFSESYKLTLCNAKGAPVSAERVTVHGVEEGKVKYTAIVYQLKEVPLAVTAVDENKDPVSDAVLTLEKETLLLKGKKSVMEELEQIQLPNIDITGMKGTNVVTVDVVLPDGVESVDGQTQVKVMVEILAKPIQQPFEISSQQFQVKGLGENMTVTFKTGLALTAYGLQEELAGLKAENIKVEVDLTEITKAGTYTIRPVITLPKGYEKITLLGDPRVSLEVVIEEPVVTQEPLPEGEQPETGEEAPRKEATP